MSIHPHFYNKDEEKYVTTGNIPHWNQRQKIYAVTFRLKDSLPTSIVQAYINECRMTFGEQEPCFTEKRELMTHRKMMQFMDTGHGECILKEEKIRRIVEEEFEMIDRDMASTHAYVIMPNHVHAIIETKGDITIQEVMHTIKRYTAIKINKVLGRSGTSVWQKEYFDRIIRSYAHYEHAMKYIMNNPLHCRQGEYTLWQRPNS